MAEMDGFEMITKRAALVEGSEMQLLEAQLRSLRIIAISAACLSLASGLVVGYWFVRMKRSFRHHLIMLLIFSDFWKATWQLTFPAVVFSGHDVVKADGFCQVSGFFMTVGIEASDIANLMIAIHSAIYIFRPSTAVGDGGLYRYRHSIYIGWIFIAVLMGSLAFIHSNTPYSVQETFCYLPVKPYWLRQALAWVPRYVIMFFIFVLYAAVYVYVKITFRTFRTNVGASTLEMGTVDEEPPEPCMPKRAFTQAPTPSHLPPIQCHGLLQPGTPRPERESQDITRCKSRCSDYQPFHRIFHPNYNATNHQHGLNRLHIPANNRHHSSRKTGKSRDSEHHSAAHSLDGAFEYFFSRSSSSETPDNNETPAEPDPLAIQESEAEKEQKRRRLAINRSLRLLFIYPLVYVGMWVLPLVVHCLQYTDYFEHHRAFPLRCFTAFTIPAQCAIDCWLFTIRERPWRYIPESPEKTFWASFKFWNRWEREKLAKQRAYTMSTSRDEWRGNKGLSIESRRAFERREAEQKEAAERWLNRGSIAPVAPLPASVSASGSMNTPEVLLNGYSPAGSSSTEGRSKELEWWDRMEKKALEEDSGVERRWSGVVDGEFAVRVGTDEEAISPTDLRVPEREARK